jgi:hypothetical protein
MALGTTTSAGDIFTAGNWSGGALPSRMDPGNMTGQAVTINKAMTNAVTSANIDLNGYVHVTTAGSIDCHTKNLTIEDDCLIDGNITNCGTLAVQPSSSGATNSFSVAAGVTIGATTVSVQPVADATEYLNCPVTLAAVQILSASGHKISLSNSDLSCASLTVNSSAILSGQGAGSTAVQGVSVTGQLTVSGTLNLCTSVSFGSCTNTGTISNSTIPLNGGTINNTGGTISGCTITGGGTIIGGTVTGCTATGGTVQCFGSTNGAGNTGVLFAAELATFLNAEIAA